MWGKNNKVSKLQSQIKEMREFITTQNQLNKAIYSFIAKGQPLTKDSNMEEYIEKGFEGNTDVFGIFTKLSNKFTLPKHKLYKIQSNGKLVDYEDAELYQLLSRPNFYQTYREFKKAWFLYKYTTGSSIVYAPKYEAGINKGKITKDGLLMMPTQNVDIYTGGWRQPIEYYTVDVNQQYKIMATDVWHERITNLQQANGENFMGTSPLKVAMDIINMQNGGQALASGMYSGGHPPGIVSKKDADSRNTDTPEAQSKMFREHYKNRYLRNPEDSKIPVFTLGDIQYVKIGYDSLRDHSILSISD